MNSSDGAEFEELSRPEFLNPSAGIPTIRYFFQCVSWGTVIGVKIKRNNNKKNLKNNSNQAYWFKPRPLQDYI